MVDGDLLALIGSDTHLERTSSHRGGEYHGPCPFCGGKDRFRVQPEENFWKCRQCGKSGDLIAYLVETEQITVGEAYRMRHGDTVKANETAKQAPVAPAAVETATSPSEQWQERAWIWVSKCTEALWEHSGEKALGWLRGRGLAAETIRKAQLGYNPADLWEDRTVWGLGPGKRIWLPRGITIPWFIGRDLWRVNVRRPVPPGHGPKYIGPAGSGNGLYNADGLKFGQPAMLIEGELDALTILQEASDLVTPCATGSTSGSRRDRWIARLALSSAVLVSFDADDAGEEARRWWLNSLPNAQYWRPAWGDVNQMYRDGVSLRAWVLTGLGTAAPANRQQRFPLTMVIPAEQAGLPGLALPNHCWERLSDGAIRVTFPDAETLEVCVGATRAIRDNLSSVGA